MLESVDLHEAGEDASETDSAEDALGEVLAMDQDDSKVSFEGVSGRGVTKGPAPGKSPKDGGPLPFMHDEILN